MPVLLVGVGVTLLMGCLYVPSTRQFQSNGRLRPDSIVGDERSSKPIRVGQTTVAEALPKLIDQIYGPRPEGRRVIEDRPRVAINPSTRQLATGFSVRTGATVSICGVDKDTDARTIVLTADEQNVIRDVDTRAGGPWASGFQRFSYESATAAFGEETARELQRAGLLYDDATRAALKRHLAEMDERRRLRQSGALPTTSRPATEASPAAPQR